MTRRYGRAPSHERVCEGVPDVRFERTSVIGALGPGGVVAPLTYKGTLNGKFFGRYVSECLAPAMRAGDTLVLDNLSAHKVRGALRPLEEMGVNVVFLPPYSPDLNPIELAWSKIKACLRAAKARTGEALTKAIAAALDSITPDDAAGWIRHCGYELQ